MLKILYFLALVFSGVSCSNPSPGQAANINPVPEIVLTEQDRTEILARIFEQELSRQSDKKGSRRTKVAYFVDDGFALQPLPDVPGLELKYLRPTEVPVTPENEITYYEFRGFAAVGDKAKVVFVWNKRDSSSRHSAILEYECIQTTGRWSVTPKVLSVAVAEKQ